MWLTIEMFLVGLYCLVYAYLIFSMRLKRGRLLGRWKVTEFTAENKLLHASEYAVVGLILLATAVIRASTSHWYSN